MNRERAKELLPIIQAFAEGKDVECLQSTGVWAIMIDPGWGTDHLQYRIKPEEPYTVPRHIEGFRALAEGEEWFTEDHVWNIGDLPAGFRPYLVGEMRYPGDEWRNDGDWKAVERPGDHVKGRNYLLHRTKRPLPPITIKKRVPLEAKDILPGSVIHNIYDLAGSWIAIERVSIEGVCFNSAHHSMESLHDYQIHHPSYGYENGLPVWKPCYKEIEVEA